MKNSEIKDAAGTIFDPQIHQIRNGAPLLRKKDGCFVLKKGVKSRLGLCENVPFRAESHKIEAVPAQPPPETAQSAESLVDAILNAGESVPTVPAPENSPEGVAPDETASFVPDDLTFPEETPGGDEGFFTSADAHARARSGAGKAENDGGSREYFRFFDCRNYGADLRGFARRGNGNAAGRKKAARSGVGKLPRNDGGRRDSALGGGSRSDRALFRNAPYASRRAGTAYKYLAES